MATPQKRFSSHSVLLLLLELNARLSHLRAFVDQYIRVILRRFRGKRVVSSLKLREPMRFVLQRKRIMC
jgi:hypothetical protein